MKKIAVLPLALVPVAGLVACGSSGPSGSGAAPSTPAAAALNGEQSKPASQVLADAKSALFNASAVHVKGQLSSDGQTGTIDMQFQGEDSKGTIDLAGTTLSIVKTGGKSYVKASESFWAKTVGTAVAPRLANKWLVQDDAKSSSLESFTLQHLAASLSSGDSPLLPTVRTATVDGSKVVVLTEKDGSTFDIANTGTPDPLRLTNTGTDKGSVAFTGYGQKQTISAPPGAVPAAQAAKSGGSGNA